MIADSSGEASSGGGSLELAAEEASFEASGGSIAWFERKKQGERFVRTEEPVSIPDGIVRFFTSTDSFVPV